ncbi:MAG TPA: thiosulfate oxidation carrier protein SoxY [Burkholderiaceae bacterium]
MQPERRSALRTGGRLGLLGVLGSLGLLDPQWVRAEGDRAGFDARSVGEALSAAGFGGAASAADVELEAPEIAENGAVVPIRVSTGLPRVDRIAILVEKNPTILSAVFVLPEGTEPSIATRVKMAETCRVIVALRSDGKVYIVSKEIKVTLGGCGG